MNNGTGDLLRRLRLSAAEAKESNFSLYILLSAAIRQIEDMQRIHQLDRAEIVRLRRMVEAAQKKGEKT